MSETDDDPLSRRPTKRGPTFPPMLVGLIAVAIALFVASQFSKQLKKASLGVGDQSLEIVGRDLDGKEFSLADYRGKVVMLDFWGNW